MDFQTYFSVESLIAAGEKKAKGKDIISFDLFDTLLIRRVHDPDLVKLPVARFVAALAEKKGINIGWQNVQDLRDKIEQRQRVETGEKFDDHEACYPLFMRELLETIFKNEFSEAVLDEVTQYELFMENSMLVPRRQFVEWIRELKEQGKRIFIISDMYLPATHMKVLVEHAGLLDYVEDVISSADTFLAKASGKGYEFIQEKYSLAKERWIHIGDNSFSDGMRAIEFGIDALIIHDPRENQRKAIVKRHINYSDGRPFWRGRALQQLMAPLEGENCKKTDLYNEGYNFLGVLIGSFVQEIVERCKKNSIGKVFFLSREGWTFKQYWEKAVPFLYPLTDLPDIEYLYVSRMALAGACCAYQGLTKNNAGIAFLPSGNRDFRDVCRIFNFEASPFVAHLRDYGLELDSCLSHKHEGYNQENSKKFDAMLGSIAFQDEVKRQALPANQALQLYLEDIGFFEHESAAIVDIGWLGTIPRFFYEAIQHRSDCPKCFGYLFGATRGIPYPTSEKNFIEGIVYDKNRFDLAASTLLYVRDLFEEACRAPFPTLNGYRLTEDGYELDFRETDDEVGRAEQQQDRHFAPLQQGIVDSAERYGAASALLGYSLEDYTPWLNYQLISKLAFPRAAEVANIRHQNHLDDFHGNKKPKAGLPKEKKVLWEYSHFQLRYNPFLRTKCFLNHLRERLNS